MADEVISFRIKATEDASKAFESVSSSLDGMADSAGQTSSRMDALRDVVGGAVSVVKTVTAVAAAAGAAVYGFTATVSAGIDKQNDFAIRVGKSVEELTAYQYAASLAGVEGETFNKSIQKLDKAASEAAIGIGEAKDAFAELGIDAQSFSRLPLDKQMDALAAELSQVSGEANQTRLAMRIFGEEGVAMVQMLKGGSEAMREAAADARFLGVAITDEMAAKAGLFSDKFDRAQASIKGVSMAIATELSPMLAGLTDEFANFVASNRGNIVSFVREATVQLFTLGHVVGQVFDQLGAIFTDKKAMGEFLSNIGDMAVGLLESVGTAVWQIGPVIWNAFTTAFTKAADLVEGFGVWLGESLAKVVTGQEVESIGSALMDLVAGGVVDSAAMVADAAGAVVDIVAERVREDAPKIGEAMGNAFGVDLAAARAEAEATIAAISLTAETVAEKTDDAAQAAVQSTITATEAGLQAVGAFAANLTSAVMATSAGIAGPMAATVASITGGAQAAAQAVTMASAVAVESTATLMDEVRTKWDEFTIWLGESNTQLAESLLATGQGAIQSLSNGLAQVMVTGASLAGVLEGVLKTTLTNIVAAFIQMGIQRLILSKIMKTAVATEATGEGAKAVALAGANMFASMAAAPFPLNLTAPAAAATAIVGATAAMTAGAAAGAAAGAGIGGAGAVMHGGMTSNPSEVTAIIQRGERVVSPRQNRDLTDFLESGGGGGLTIENLSVVVAPNATTADAILGMNTADLAAKMQDAVLLALDNAADRGIKPRFLERLA